jgi:hypothetical protein
MKDPFGFRESSVDRILREEHERARRYDDMLGGGAAAKAIREATNTKKLLGEFHKPHRGVLDSLEREREQQAQFRRLTSTPWALSVSETARSIVDRNAGLVDDQRRLSNSVLNTVRAFDLNRSVMAGAIAAASAGATYRRMIEDAFPRLSALGAIAEQMRLVDAMTLRASEGAAARSSTALAAEMVLETQRIAEAILAAPSDEESVALHGKLLELVVGFVARLGPNTITELHNMGLVQWSNCFVGVLGLLLAIAALSPGQSAEEKAAFAELNQKVEILQEETDRYHDAEGRAEEAYVAGLPKAQLVRDATFRREPRIDGAVVLKARKETVLAIEGSQGRWRLVVFRDPLSDQLARAWVYATAISPLAPPLAPDALS